MVVIREKRRCYLLRSYNEFALVMKHLFMPLAKLIDIMVEYGKDKIFVK